jgi:uncharacterized membrane protein YjfL (UPF0719 family)
MKGLSGVGASIVAFVVGAILRFAITVTSTGFNINKIGIILMWAGVIGFVISMVVFFVTRDSGHHVQRSETVDSRGNAVVTTREQS